MAVAQLELPDSKPAAPVQNALEIGYKLPPPWDFQQKAIDAVLDELKIPSGSRRMLISVSTGGGKTIIASWLAKLIGRQVVFLAHRDELISQAIDKLGLINPEKSIGRVQAEYNELGRDITVGSIQTVQGRRLDQLVSSLRERPLVIADESHHAVSKTWVNAIEALDPYCLIGLTATGFRGDGAPLGRMFDKIIYHIPMLELMARGYLAQMQGVRVESKVNLDFAMKNRRKADWSDQLISPVVDTPERNALIVKAWEDHASDRKRTVVFAATIEHAMHISQAFNARQLWTEVITGKTPTKERHWLLERFSDGDLPRLVNVGVLTEGYDEPQIDAIIMARPTKSTGLFIQCVGRGARIAPGKEDCLVIDVVDNTSLHSLVTLPTLAGIDTSTGKVISKTEKARKAGQVVNLLDLADDASVADRQAIDVNLFTRSKYAWKRSAGMWYTPTPTGFLVLVPDPIDHSRWSPVDLGGGGKSKRLTDRSTSLDLAMTIAEGAAPRDYRNDRGARWRLKDSNPTPQQLDMAGRLSIAEPQLFTKNELSDLITERLFSIKSQAARLASWIWG